MGTNEYSKTVSEKLIRTDVDYSYTESQLRTSTERIRLRNSDFYQKIDGIFFVEDQKGKIVDELLLAADKQKKKEQTIINDINEEIRDNIQNLEEQVEQVRKQSLTITYKDKWDLF